MNPVRINDLTSEFHSAMLSKGQDLILTLRHAKALKILHGPHLTIKEHIKSDKEESITFAHSSIKDDEWDKCSTVYLGEIAVSLLPDKINETTDSQEVTRKIAVFLQCSDVTKSNVVTVMNPEAISIKIDPYHIVEVVVQDPYFGNADEWDYVFQTERSTLEVGFKLLGRRTLMLSTAYLKDWRDTNDIYYLKARADSWQHPVNREHHFWFRLDQRIKNLVNNTPSDIYYIGDILFRGRQSDDPDAKKVTRRISIYLNQKAKFEFKVKLTMQVEELSEDKAQFYPIDLDENKSIETTKKDPTYHTHKKKEKWHSHQPIGVSGREYEGIEDYYGYSYKKRNTIREINIVKLFHSRLEENCDILPIMVGDKKLIPITTGATKLLTCVD